MKVVCISDGNGCISEVEKKIKKKKIVRNSSEMHPICIRAHQRCIRDAYEIIRDAGDTQPEHKVFFMMSEDGYRMCFGGVSDALRSKRLHLGCISDASRMHLG